MPLDSKRYSGLLGLNLKVQLDFSLYNVHDTYTG
jgi:hypothetical protein